MSDNNYKTQAENIYIAWNQALEELNKEALLGLYAQDAILESPLVPKLMQRDSGICYGRDEIAQVFAVLAQCQPKLRKFHRTPLLQSGNYIMWEYPRDTPNGEQMDFAEIMVLNDEGLIQSHRVYWGWRGVKVLRDDVHHKG